MFYIFNISRNQWLEDNSRNDWDSWDSRFVHAHEFCCREDADGWIKSYFRYDQPHLIILER